MFLIVVCDKVDRLEETLTGTIVFFRSDACLIL